MLVSPSRDDVLLDARVAGLLPLPTTTDADRAVLVGGTVMLLLDVPAGYVQRCGAVAVSGVRPNPRGRIEFRPTGPDETQLLIASVPVPGGGTATTLAVLLHKVFTLTGFDFALWPRLVEAADGDPLLVARGVAVGATSGDEAWLSNLGSDTVAAMAALRGYVFRMSDHHS